MASRPTPSSPRSAAPSVEKINTARAKRAWAELEKNAALRHAYERLHAIVQNGSRVEALRRYTIGVVVRAVRNDKNKYGKSSVETLAALLGYDKSTLHDYANVAEVWDSSEFKRIMKRVSQLKIPVTFSHLIVIAERTSAKERAKLVDRVLDDSLTVQQLREVVGGRVDEGEDEGDTEPVEARDVRRASAAWLGEIDQLRSKTEWVIKRATANPEATVLDELAQCAERQREIAKQATENAAKIDSAVAELTPQLKSARAKGRKVVT